MPAGSSSKRERQYEHIKESYEKRGQKGRAKEIAARTVNKERAEHGEAESSSRSGARSSSKPSKSSKSSSGPSARSSAKPSSKSSSRSSSKPSARSSSRSSSGRASARGERTRAQLYDEAKRRGIEGRSSMNKAQLERALSR